MEFVLLFVDRKDQPPRAPLYEEMRKFAGELREAGVMRLSAGPLLSEAEAARVKVREGRAFVTDGPFAESREVIAGFFGVDVADRAAAVELAGRCPFARVGTVEVRGGRLMRGGPETGAPQFLLFYQLERGAPLPDEARIRQGMAEMQAFADDLERKGSYLGGGALPPQAPAARVTSHAGRTAVTDGPFAESKEVIAGFALIQAGSRDEAIAISKTVPHAAWGGIEVREVAQLRR